MAKPISTTPSLNADQFIGILREDYEISKIPVTAEQRKKKELEFTNFKKKHFTFGEGVSF